MSLKNWDEEETRTEPAAEGERRPGDLSVADLAVFGGLAVLYLILVMFILDVLKI